MRIISAIAVIAISLMLGGCFASVVNAYSSQDTTLRSNDILVNGPGSAPVLPDGGGGS